MISFSSRAVSHRKFERTYRARCSTSSTRSRRESPSEWTMMGKVASLAPVTDAHGKRDGEEQMD